MADNATKTAAPTGVEQLNEQKHPNMPSQIIFTGILLISLGILFYSFRRFALFFKLTKAGSPIKNFRKRIILSLQVAFGQSKIFRLPLIGLVHALVFWGFLVISLGSLEMIVDGISGSERSFSGLDWFYNLIMLTVDIFAYIVLAGIVIFLVRRFFLKIRRFSGIEMRAKSKNDANFALALILFLMISLIGMNLSYLNLESENIVGVYPISHFLSSILQNFSEQNINILYKTSWWSHIILIFFFANYLPYSKHFHVFASIPNVFLSSLDPLGKLPNMDSITTEVKLMMNPETAFSSQDAGAAPISRFGVKDIEDVTWKNYLDSLTCTQCGRCTAVCPANITGKKLSPRKIFIDLRQRMNEKGRELIKKEKEYSDSKSLIKDYISYEELWACTTCNACAMECPLNISHPNLIIDMRRYLVMEEAAAPAGLNMMFTNIENNGAPWQYSPEDRLNWTEE